MLHFKEKIYKEEFKGIGLTEINFNISSITIRIIYFITR